MEERELPEMGSDRCSNWIDVRHYYVRKEILLVMSTSRNRLHSVRGRGGGVVLGTGTVYPGTQGM